MTLSIITGHCYAKCHLCWVLMLSVTCMLSAVMLNVVMLSVVMLIVVAPNIDINGTAHFLRMFIFYRGHHWKHIQLYYACFITQLRNHLILSIFPKKMLLIFLYHRNSWYHSYFLQNLYIFHLFRAALFGLKFVLCKVCCSSGKELSDTSNFLDLLYKTL
jgi:hypothetical protein